MINHQLTTTVSQKPHLVMSYAMEQAFTALTLPLLELQQWMHAQIESNPLLTLHPEKITLLPLDEHALSAPKENEALLEIFCALPKQYHAFAEYLYYSMDKNGVLTEDFSTILKSWGIDRKVGDHIITKLKAVLGENMFSFSTKEALLQKLLLIQHPNAPIFDAAYDDLLSKKYGSIVRQWNLSFDELKAMVKLSCETGSSERDTTLSLFPDIILHENSGILSVDTRRELLPSFSINHEYVALAANDQRFVRRYIAHAKWLNRALQKRHSILTKGIDTLLPSIQRYLDGLESSLPVLPVKEVCKKLNCHESTFARAVSNKVIATPFGTFPLKQFFSGKKPFEIEHVLSEAVAKEDKEAPLKDSELVELLQDMGIACRRRTIAKYRHTLGIPKASLRKMSR